MGVAVGVNAGGGRAGGGVVRMEREGGERDGGGVGRLTGRQRPGEGR